jgi:hypothetical protein
MSRPKYEASHFAFRTRREAEAFRDRIRNTQEWHSAGFVVACPPSAVLTAHVVGPNRRGKSPDYPFLVATGCRRTTRR